MFFNSRALLLATFISAVTASPLFSRAEETSPLSPTSPIPRALGTACGEVATQVASADGNYPTVASQLALDCIRSVPLNKANALELVRTMRPFLNWQSTTTYLKDPPADWAAKTFQAPVDLFGGLDKIKSQLNSGFFKSEYDFGLALYTLIQSAHDGHLKYVPDIVGRVFQWGRPLSLVSVSEDGVKLPSLFVYSDILESTQNTAFNPSPITKINGEEAISYIENFVEHGNLQDRDALWNNAFFNLAQVGQQANGTGTGIFSGGGTGRWIFPGATTDLVFANASKKSYTNFARVMQPMTGIASGEDLAKKYFTYDTTTFDLTNAPTIPDPVAAAAPTASVTRPAGYPKATAEMYTYATVKQASNSVAGYYLDQPGYEDVAVLSVPSFDGNLFWQETYKKFLTNAFADKKTKLVIDLSANGGGNMLAGYDLFKALFPNADPFAAGDRFRAHEAYDLLGQFASNISGFYPRTRDIPDKQVLNFMASHLNYRNDLDAETGAHFGSWKEKYTPETHQGDSFTNLFKWSLKQDVMVRYQSGGIEVTGYGTPATSQHWDASSIVLVYDGYCASTCTIFSELMRMLGGVQTVAMGGRPNDKQIQAVGGTKGTNNFSWKYIQNLVNQAYNYTSSEQQVIYDKSALGVYNSYLPLQRAVGEPQINVRDGIRKGDTTSTPLQFVYEEADCRLFYTPAMTVDTTAIWRAAADVKWGKGTCVAGALKGVGVKKNRRNKKKRVVRARSETAKVMALDVSQRDLLAKSLGQVAATQDDPWAQGRMFS